MNCLRVALVQMGITKSKSENLKKVVKLIGDAKKEGSDVVILPECFNSPYGTKYFKEYSENIPEGQTSQILSKAARENSLHLVGGSIPEREGDKLYNTCTVWAPTGQMIAKHRKVHLFDIDIPGGIKFKESEVLSPGENLNTFDIPLSVGVCRVGLGICYDLRFQEMASLYQKKGVHFLIYPGAFNMKTGPLHWELILRARAVDNQVFVAGVCGARDPEADYVAWGHSMLVDPWGKILTQADHKETLLIQDIDLQNCEDFRYQVPIIKQRRTDLYETVSTTSLKKKRIMLKFIK